MRKFLKNQKGFTLIELMLVIAVIGILAAVLIPKVSGIKEEAKNTGLDANIRIIQAYAGSMIDKYAADDTGAEKFEDDLVAKLGDLVNPVTNVAGVDPVAAVGTDSAKAVIHIDNSVSDDTWVDDTGEAGCIGLSACVLSSKLALHLTPIKADGKKGTVVTVEQ